MQLTPEQQLLREGKVTGSFLPPLMAGKAKQIFNKYQEIIGDPEFEPLIDEDDWAPAWGSHGEKFILDWHERKTGHPITRRGEFIPHPNKDFVGVTLDGFREFDRTALDAKVVNAWTPVDEHLAYYAPQMIAQRTCLQCDHAALVMVHGNAAPVEYEIIVDAAYERTLWTRVDQFWYCCQNFIPPVELEWPRVVPAERLRSVDLDVIADQFNWATEMKDLLGLWNSSKDLSDVNAETTKDIKQLLPADIGTLTFAGLIVKRNRANAVSIKRMKA